MGTPMHKGGEAPTPFACPTCGHMRYPEWCPECDAGTPEPVHPSVAADEDVGEAATED